MTKRFRVDDYESARGGKARSFSINIQQLAEYPEPDLHYWHTTNRPWVEFKPNAYIRAPESLQDARQLIANFEFPHDLKAEAQRASRYMTDAFKDVARMQIVRDQIRGRLDGRKLSRLVSSSLAGTYTVEAVRPYRRVQPMPIQPPVVAVIADGSTGVLRSSPTYAPQTISLVLSILWACQASNLVAKSALVQGTSTPGYVYDDAIQALMLSDGLHEYGLKNYAALFHLDMYRAAVVSNSWADLESIREMQAAQKYKYRFAGNAWSSLDGGNGVQWAREVLGADVVIAIGNIIDRDKAEVVLPANLDLQTAVKSIARQASKLSHTA